MTLRDQIRVRARGLCEYCQSPARISTHSFALEHIRPRSQGGPTSLENLAFCCQGCNNHKYNRTEACDPATGRIVRLFHPRRDLWSEHFTWDDRFERMIGITPIGRATIEALQLNREELLNLRHLLFSAGEHPPPLIGDEPR